MITIKLSDENEKIISNIKINENIKTKSKSIRFALSFYKMNANVLKEKKLLEKELKLIKKSLI